MCDEFTNLAMEQAVARKALSRRQFGVLGASAALVACSGRIEAGGPSLSESMVSVKTPDGTIDAFFVHPASGKHPGVIFWPDIVGLREAKKAMARRLAAEGHAVLVVNQYYRSTPAPVMESFAEFRTPEGRERLSPMIALITPDAIARDAAASVAWLDGQDAVDTARRIGSQGYCMGGPFAVRTAAAAPGRVGAAASFHGGGLVGDAPDSPVQLLAKSQASYLFAIARNDDERAPGDKDALRAAADAAGRGAEIEVYPADHGWCVPDSPVYDAAQADRAFERLLALYAGL